MNDWVKGRLAGWTPGVHLNDEGRQQVATLSERLKMLPIAAIYSSPLERAVETAEAIAQPHGLAVQQVEAVGEVHYGEWMGAEIKELAKLELWAGVQHYPSGTRFPGGETLGEVQMRAITALDALRERHPKEIIAVIGHADVIKLVIAYYIGMHIDLFQRLVINPASLTALAFEPMGPRLLAFNETGSLEHLQPRSEEPAEPPAESSAAQQQATP
jgi:probable phosphoglycerate mutase